MSSDTIPVNRILPQISRASVDAKISEIRSRGSAFLSSGTAISKITKAALVVVVVIVLSLVIKYLYKAYCTYSNASPWILKGTKDARKRMIVLQDPAKYGAVTLGRSKNEYGGLEFTYMWWMHIDDWSYRNGDWKHIFHKGNDNASPLQCPGVWLHKTKNVMRVHMNTFEKIDEYMDIENIPLNKWVHCTLSIKQKHMDIYINGNLAKRHNLKGLPKQNHGDLYLNSFKGFGGFLSNVRYFNYHVSFMEIDAHMKLGPSKKPAVDSGERPPYFTPSWWVNI
tara:strand:- start:759 stop:1601 length:843 start_codon:yes stop_codon:yes gene_type:complete